MEESYDNKYRIGVYGSRNICQKLQIHSVSGLTIYAIANKLIEM